MTPAWVGADRLVGARYALEALIGRGGMGEVWRARHVALDTLVAIKLLLGAAEPSERARRRFLTEARVTATLKTRYAVQVFDFGVTEDGLPYLVMELLEGDTLSKRIGREGRLAPATTSRFLHKAARALEKAHALGIVHRDFKPENVMLVEDEEDGGETVKVVDFGIAKLVGDLESTLKTALSTLARRPGASYRPTRSATSGGVGTPQYMAPEQVRDSPDVGPAADIWAFGVVAYECLTGRRPFEAASVGELMRKVLAATPPPPASSIAPVPTAFDDWFVVACARDPRHRFADVQTAALALASALDPVAAPLHGAGEPPQHEVRGPAGEAPGAGAEASPPAAPTLASAADAPLASGPRPSRHELEALLPVEVSPLASTVVPLPSPPRPPSPASGRGGSTRFFSPSPAQRERGQGGEGLAEQGVADTSPPRFGLARTAMGALAAAALALTLAVHDAPSPVADVASRVVAAHVSSDRPPPSATHPASASLPLAEPTAAPPASPPPETPSIDEGPAPLAPPPSPETDVRPTPQEPSAPPSTASGPASHPPRSNARLRSSTARSSAFALGPLGL